MIHKKTRVTGSGLTIAIAKVQCEHKPTQFQNFHQTFNL